MEFLLQDKAHFLHKKEVLPGNQKVPLIQQKKQLLEQFLAQPSAHGHQWVAYRFGVQCSQCKQRYHSKSMVKEIKEGLSTACMHAVPGRVLKKTRFQVIHDLLEAQGEVEDGAHHLRLDKAYLRCDRCKGYVLARAGEETFHRFWERFAITDLWSLENGMDTQHMR